MRRCARLLGAWFICLELAGCGHGSPASAASTLPASLTPAMAPGLAGTSPKVTAPGATPSDASAATQAQNPRDDTSTGTDTGGANVVAQVSAPAAPPEASVPGGPVPPLPADKGTPPAYPSEATRHSRDLVLLAQEVAYIDPVLTSGAKSVVTALVDLGVSHVDMWYGSHIELAGDAGTHYSLWTAPGNGATVRTSSHISSAPQYQIPVGFRDQGILIGKTPAGDTWLQFERHAYHVKDVSDLGKIVGIIESIGSAHGNDYMIYLRYHQNVGPLGLSPYTDKNALVIPAGKRAP